MDDSADFVALLQDENRDLVMRKPTTNGICVVLGRELDFYFRLKPGTSRLHQNVSQNNREVLFELPFVMRNNEREFLLDIQFGKMFVVSGVRLQSRDAVTQAVDVGVSICSYSVVDMIRGLPPKNVLHMALTEVSEKFAVEELPSRYDGNVLFEFPPAKPGARTFGLQLKFDGHIWSEEVTTHNSAFNGVVRLRKCGGAFTCENIMCPYLQRTGIHNDTHWKGRLTKVPLIGQNTSEVGTLQCMHCKVSPICKAMCPCKMYICLPHVNVEALYSRCVIHLGFHLHRVAEGMSQNDMDSIKSKVTSKTVITEGARPRFIQQKVAEEVVLEAILKDGVSVEKMSEVALQKLVDSIAPLLDGRRISRWKKEVSDGGFSGPKGLDKILDLKNKSCYDYIQSTAFPGQLSFSSFDRAHVFKMSTLGAGSGVDLVNKMRPGGDLESCWVCFDHVRRIKDWHTMACHVYNPYVQELQTIAIGEFCVQDTEAQVLFWTMLNNVMERQGYKPAEFAGFIGDEAQANWLAVRTVFNEGPDNIMVGRERTCLWHWEDNLDKHARTCIPPSDQAEFKARCRLWKDSPTKTAADKELRSINEWLESGHAIEGKMGELQRWIVWWHARDFHWGEYIVKGMEGEKFLIPRTNLSESVHGSWLATNNNIKYISLYDACTRDLTSAVLQTVSHEAFLKGQHLGEGPSVQKLQSKYCRRTSHSFSQQSFIDLTNEVAQEMNVSKDIPIDVDKMRTIRKKRSKSLSQPVHKDDSHRPEFQNVSRPIRRRCSMVAMGGAMEVPQREACINEVDIHQTVWAIRRTNPGSLVKCQGYDPLKRGKCDVPINPQGRSTKMGVPAPSFYGRVSTKSGVFQQMVWFCPTDVHHTWSPSKASIVELHQAAPAKWVVAKGTNIDLEELTHLQAAGFIFETQQSSMPMPRPITGGVTNSSRFERPKMREGQNVVVRRVVTKEMQIRLNSIEAMECNVLQVNVIREKEHVEFLVDTTSSRRMGLQYTVTISVFPACTCEDFVRRSARSERYMPCKHIYYIFIAFLGVDKEKHSFIHQAALTRSELHEAFLSFL